MWQVEQVLQSDDVRECKQECHKDGYHISKMVSGTISNTPLRPKEYLASEKTLIIQWDNGNRRLCFATEQLCAAGRLAG